MLETLRNKSFWFVDFLKGGKYKKNYTDIKHINNNYSNLEVKKRKNLLLQKILKHVITTTNYYCHLDVNSTLDEFPVIDKNIIREDFDEFESKLYKNQKKYKVATSGSTGTPFTTYLNSDKKNRNSIDAIYFAEKAGFKLGEQLFYIRLWDEQHKRSNLSAWIQNIVSHNISDLKDNDISRLLDRMQRSDSNKGFLAYASAYDAIGHYLDKKKYSKLDYKINSIIAISEGLSNYAKQSMEKYFGVPVVSRYSASETGIIAQQDRNSNDFKINWASYVVEILDVKNDIPVKYGELGKIVITDLFNYSVPMIRYDTGDLGIMDLEKDSGEPVLTRIEGRKMDMLYDTKGELITSHIVHQICLYRGIKQYQLIQTDKKEYLFKINATEEFVQEQEMIDSYKKYFGKDATVKIDYVDDIPILSSGKRKKVINLYK